MHSKSANVALLDSISAISSHEAGKVVISGSHGGSSAASFVSAVFGAVSSNAQLPLPKLVILNDAGIGKDQAGIAALALLEGHGIAAACYSHDSARIGEAQDALSNGVVSNVNALALALGVQPSQTVTSVVTNQS